MIQFITENLGTLLTSLVILGIVVAIVVKIVRDKRKGKCISCSCGCSGCSKSVSCCNSEKENKE